MTYYLLNIIYIFSNNSNIKLLLAKSPHKLIFCPTWSKKVLAKLIIMNTVKNMECTVGSVPDPTYHGYNNLLVVKIMKHSV